MIYLFYGMGCLLMSYGADVQDTAPIPDEINDPSILSVNQEAPHVPLIPYSNIQQAIEGKRDQSPFFLLLKEPWKVNHSLSAQQRPLNFFENDFNDSTWSIFQFVDERGIFQKNKIEKIDKNINSVSSYRHFFDLPANWNCFNYQNFPSNRHVFITFEGASSAFYFWINGRYVGYCGKGQSVSEFDITRYIKSGKNLIAIEMYQQNAISFFSDQELSQKHKFFDSIYIWSSPKTHIRDFSVTADLDSNYQNGLLHINASIKNYHNQTMNHECTLNAQLFDSVNQLIGEVVKPVTVLNEGDEQQVDLSLKIKNPKKWSPESPTLYTLVLSLNEQRDENLLNNSHDPMDSNIHLYPLEYLSTAVGFRKIEFEKDILKINGKSIELKDINWINPLKKIDYRMCKSEKIELIKQLKKQNLNYILIQNDCDYLQWLELCDQYGLWVCSRANINFRNFLKDQKQINETLLQNIIFNRNVSNVVINKNHPSIIMWSVGCFSQDQIKYFFNTFHTLYQLDSSRPIYKKP